MNPCPVADIRWPGQKRRAVGHKRQHVINRRLRVLPTCPEWLRLSRRSRDAAATMLHHSRHRGESATKTIKFFVAHTVNYVICNNHTRIDCVLLNFTPVITRGQFWPSGIVVACVCLCVCPYVCVNPQLVRAITCHLFNLESPNLDQKCKTTWLRSLLFLDLIDLELQGQI